MDEFRSVCTAEAEPVPMDWASIGERILKVSDLAAVLHFQEDAERLAVLLSDQDVVVGE